MGRFLMAVKMDDEKTKPENTRRVGVFTEHAVWFGTLIGGPLAAGYIISENFRILKMPDKQKKTWWIIVPETLLMLVLSIKLNGDMGFIYFVNTVLTFLVFHIFQGKEVEDYLKAGGYALKKWTTFLIAIEGMIASFLLYFIADYLYANVQAWFYEGRF
jgi:hypothetical protein